MSKKNTVKADEIPVVILTNERTPFKAQQILMMYKAAGLAQLAYMDGLNPDTGEIDALLVGLEPVEKEVQFKVFPLAKLFNKLNEIPAYLVPDGNGSYIDYKTNTDESSILEPIPEEAGPASEG